MLDVSWKWLPKTGLFVNVNRATSTTTTTATGSATLKNDSYPLIATVGVRGLLTEKTSVLLAVGYMNGFYSDGRIDQRVPGQHVRESGVHACCRPNSAVSSSVPGTTS